jgi:hypothetical protein
VRCAICYVCDACRACVVSAVLLTCSTRPMEYMSSQQHRSSTELIMSSACIHPRPSETVESKFYVGIDSNVSRVAAVPCGAAR